METYLAQREALIADAASGIVPARRLAVLTDEALARLAESSPSRPRGTWALVALGGYGAGALMPGSDLDLLIVSNEAPRKLKPFVESVFYPLWDAGLKVGHQVRTARDQVRATREDIQTLCATLTGRTIAGDRKLGESVVASCIADAHKRRKAVLAELQRRERPGSPYLLEPDLKEGAGGRRDYDELVWTASLLTGTRTADPDALLGAGLLTAEEAELLAEASRTVAAARWEIQRRGGTSSAYTLDAASSAEVDPQRVQQSLADTAQILMRVRARQQGMPPSDEPLDAERALALLAAGGDESLAALETAAWSGALDALVPGYSSLLTLRRPGLGHRYTVGAHSLRAATSIASICQTARGSLQRSCHAVEDRPALLVAALLHDVGKRDGGAEHARAGAEPAHDAALAFGFRPSRAQDVADLVRLHLVLVEVANRDDIDDEDVVLRAAMRIGRRSLVAPLHILTVADSMATGTATWGPWQEALLGRLASRLDAALSPDIDGAGMAARAENVRAGALELLGERAGETEHRFIERASLRYLGWRDAAEVVSHARLVASLGTSGAAGVAVGHANVEGAFTVAVAAPDRPDLFSRIAGAFALAGLDILGADAAGAHDGTALDVFTVRSATRAEVTEETWHRFERYLHAALADRLELATRLAERRRHYPAAQGTPLSVDFDRSAGYGTLVKVTAGDRVGLLHDLTSAISREGLDIRWAKVLTSEHVARDTFLVVGPDGGPVDDPGVLGHLAMRFREIA